MKKTYVIDCEGNKVLMGNQVFSAKCWVGNITDYLEANDKFIIADAAEWRDIPKISILLPIYRAGDSFLRTLNSIISQKWSQPEKVEIILSINQPLCPIEELTANSLKAAKTFIEANDLKDNTPLVKLVFEQLAGGLAEVYQRNFSTLVVRIQRNVNARKLETKEENVAALSVLMNSTIFAIIDDDQILLDNKSLPAAVNKLKAGKSAIMGQVEITEVSSSYPQWNAILVGVMNLFFRFKYELGTAILTPRALMVSDLFHMPALRIGEAYADQIWFAAASAKKERFMIEVTTTLKDEEYPSNANMVKHLAEFLQSGENSNAINIFKNLQTSYEESTEKLVYSLGDLNQLISSLETRDKKNIEIVIQQILYKQQNK